MTTCEPLSIPLDNSFRPMAEEVMRRWKVRLLATDAVWDSLRRHRPEDWQEVLDSLCAFGAATRKFFDRG